MAANKDHAYHLVPLSAWPIVASIAALVTVIGGVLFMHGVTAIPFYVGLALILFSAYGWFKDVIDEAEIDKEHTPVVQRGLRIGMMLFIATEVMFFAGFFWAFFDASMFPKMATGGQWPPKGIDTIAAFRLPYLNTLLLLLSGTTITWAHHALLEGDRKGLKRGLFFTVLLGVIFLSVQVFEYSHAAFAFKDSIFGSTFYMSTGFHGAHVLVGSIILLVCLIRAVKGQFTPKQHVGFESGAWYWHFVDVVWLFLFVWVYWWGGSN